MSEFSFTVNIRDAETLRALSKFMGDLAGAAKTARTAESNAFPITRIPIVHTSDKDCTEAGTRLKEEMLIDESRTVADNTPPTGSVCENIFAPAIGAPPVEPELVLDARGLPWSAEIHSSGKKFMKNGNWKMKRQLNPAFVAQVEDRIRPKKQVAPPTETQAEPEYAETSLPTSEGNPLYSLPVGPEGPTDFLQLAVFTQRLGYTTPQKIDELSALVKVFTGNTVENLAGLCEKVHLILPFAKHLEFINAGN